jgi:hypothetical protein
MQLNKESASGRPNRQTLRDTRLTSTQPSFCLGEGYPLGAQRQTSGCSRDLSPSFFRVFEVMP